MTSISYKASRVILLILSKTLELINKERAPSAGTASLVLNQNKSFLRWGDGETALALGRSIYFQKHSLSLQFGLINILRDKNNNFELYLPSTTDKKNLSSSMVLTRQISIVLRPYERNLFALDFRERNLIEIISEKAPTNTILVGSSLESYKKLKEIFREKNKELDFLYTPTENSWEKLKNFKNQFLKSTLIILAAGPGGKLFGYELIKNGYTVWDIGHGIEFSFGLKGKGWTK